MNLHVIEEKGDGIVVKGAKIMICGVAAANEILVLPGMKYGEEDKNWAVAFVIPKDAEGLRCIETRHPGDERELEEGFDSPVECGGITQSYLLFENVFVPRERIFMLREHDFTLEMVMNFIAPYRAAIGACVAGQGDVMVGASILMAWANGLSEKVFRDKLTQMVINNETTYGMGVASAVLGKNHPSGTWMVDPLLSNVNKVYVATLPYETKRLFESEDYGELVQKYLKAAAPAEPRARIARLIEWLTLGAGIPGCMHGGGSPDGARLVIQRSAGFDRCVKLAEELSGIEEESVKRP
jgi:4-hydroxybutyryl-CoA dehydratase/vinylacetyl-CoA-Delta-isomerase